MNSKPEGEVVSKKHLPHVGFIVAPVCSTWNVLCFKEGYLCKRFNNSPFQRCLSGYEVLSPVQKPNTHHGEKMFVWFRSYFHRSRSRTLISPGRKSIAFEKVPFLGTKNVPRLIYWGHNKTNTRQMFFQTTSPCFHLHSEIFLQAIDIESKLLFRLSSC